jgi:iron complex transport system ATP-binding protein
MKLEARNITVAVKGSNLVSDCSLQVNPGELVGLIGPNGAGKSTLLKAIMGLRPRDAGEVEIGGKAAAAIQDRERARLVAFLPQERRVEWLLPSRDIVMLGRYPHQIGFGGATAADHAAVARALEEVDGLQLAERPVSVLSGGERTRILLARALAVEAPLLIADEPIAALDPWHQLHVMEILQRLAREGRGVLVVIHDLSLAARFMDRLILMHEGRIVRQGSPDAVLTDEGLAEVYGINVVRSWHDGATLLAPWSRR